MKAMLCYDLYKIKESKVVKRRSHFFVATEELEIFAQCALLLEATLSDKTSTDFQISRTMSR